MYMNRQVCAAREVNIIIIIIKVIIGGSVSLL